MRAPLISLWLKRALLAVVFGTGFSTQADDADTDEELLKTAYVYNFFAFTRWPETGMGSGDEPLLLCTTGADSQIESLQSLNDETVDGRPIRVQARDGRDIDDCDALYIGASAYPRLGRLLDQARQRPMLTVSEIRGFADSGGMIQMYRARSRIRFRINVETARLANLGFSARLLDLADIVDGGAPR
jgi:hypothetical protein